MNNHIAKNVTDFSVLCNTPENKEHGLISVIDCDIKDNCISVISYLDKIADTLTFHTETEDVMKYLKESNTFNLLENKDEMSRICGFCPDFAIESGEKQYAFVIQGDEYDYYIKCDLNTYTAQVYVYSKSE